MLSPTQAASAVIVNLRRSSMEAFQRLSWFVLTSFLHCIATTTCSRCQWRFDSCSPINDACGVRLVYFDSKWKVCYIPRWKRVRIISRHSPLPKFCSTDPWCSTTSVWCAWGQWSRSSVTCGRNSSVETRSRQRCCHPVRLTRDRRLSCIHRATEQRVRDSKPCEQEDGILAFIKRTQLWCIFIGVSILALGVLILMIQRHYKRRKALLAHHSPPRQQQIPIPQIPFPSDVDLTTRNDSNTFDDDESMASLLDFILNDPIHRSLSAASDGLADQAAETGERRGQEADVSDGPPTYEDGPSTFEEDPPAYEDVQRNGSSEVLRQISADRESAPPMYEDALRLVTPQRAENT